jgi:uncharacterized RDD family membrane protein YckC
MDTSVTYAGFWRRLVAGVFDSIFLLFLSITINTSWLVPDTTKAGYLLSTLFWGLLGTLYFLLMHASNGQTLGKRIAGIKLVRLDLQPIGFKESLLRSSVDILLQIVGSIGLIIAISKIDSNLLIDLPPWWGGAAENSEALNRQNYAVEEFNRLDPTSGIFQWLSLLWVISEMITLLFNEKKRAIHDFIAGTVVIVTKPTSVEANSTNISN